MSCTIFYKGKLKKKYLISEFFEIITKKVTSNNWEYSIVNNTLVIDYDNSISEPLIFRFNDHEFDGFCKVISENNDILELIFSLFYDNKSLFYKLHINDDLGLWNDFVIRKDPCEIKLRDLTEEEMEFILKFDKNISSADVLYSIIASDIIGNAFKGNVYELLVSNINPNVPSYDANSSSTNIFCILETWLYKVMQYKDYGYVKDILMETKGLVKDMQVFSFGIAECILFFCGGCIGRKQSQIRKLYTQEIYNKKIDIQKDHILMYRFVLSVLDYLKFKK